MQNHWLNLVLMSVDRYTLALITNGEVIYHLAEARTDCLAVILIRHLFHIVWVNERNSFQGKLGPPAFRIKFYISPFYKILLTTLLTRSARHHVFCCIASFITIFTQIS